MTPKIDELLCADQAVAKAGIDKISLEELLAPAAVISRNDASLVKAALYLKHGFLDECHRIAQAVETPNGSYWHAIMHRHEGDFPNAKYWYRRVGNHPVLAQLGADFDAARFVDECAKKSSDATRKLEEKEFELLLAHTVRAATAQS